MAGVLPPVLKGIFVCDDVLGAPIDGKPIVVNVWNATRLPAGAPLPYTLKKLCVFACSRVCVAAAAARRFGSRL